MKKLIERVFALPLWVKAVSAGVALVLITAAVTLILHLTPAETAAERERGDSGTVAATELSSGITEEQTASEESSAETSTEKPAEKNTDNTEDNTEADSTEPSQSPSVSTEYTEGDYGYDSGSEPVYESRWETEYDTEREPEASSAPTVGPTAEEVPEPTAKPAPTPTSAPETEPRPQPTEPETEPETEPTAPDLSAKPTVTVCAQVGPGKMIVAGSCSVDTEYIRVFGDGVTRTDIYPDKGTAKSYFIGTVYYSRSTVVNLQAKQPGKELSLAVTGNVGYSTSMKDYMTSDEYMPVFCKNSRMHFYSALLCYTLSDRVTGNLKNTAKKNITETVNTANEVGAEVIYLVVPSSAAVYPETVPEEYPAATGETVFEAFRDVAQSCGATVIYPLDTMTAHKNDGEGMKIYHNTDSHWSTYGAYWGLYDLMTHISKKYPSAKPRSLDEMGFYTEELYAGDSVFSFPGWMGFEDVSSLRSNGMTVNTRLKELVPLYKKSFGTNTLSTIFRGNKSVYIDQGNGEETTVYNADASLPSALVLRDSFGCTVYDMLSDRFSETHWQPNGSYRLPKDQIREEKPDYIIYVVSERNLLKVMTGNENASITSLK